MPDFNQPASPQEEAQFQAWAQALPWYQEFKQKYGEAPNLEPGQGDYDYRQAFRTGVVPQKYAGDGTYHWSQNDPSGKELKALNHPSAWMGDYMSITGGRDPIVNPAPRLSLQQINEMNKALTRRYGK